MQPYPRPHTDFLSWRFPNRDHSMDLIPGARVSILFRSESSLSAHPSPFFPRLTHKVGASFSAVSAQRPAFISGALPSWLPRSGLVLRRSQRQMSKNYRRPPLTSVLGARAPCAPFRSDGESGGKKGRIMEYPQCGTDIDLSGDLPLWKRSCGLTLLFLSTMAQPSSSISERTAGYQGSIMT